MDSSHHCWVLKQQNIFFSDAPSPHPQESRQEHYMSGKSGAFGAFPPQGCRLGLSRWEAEFSLGHDTGNLAFTRLAGVDPAASFSKCLGLIELLLKHTEGYLSYCNVKIKCEFAQFITLAVSWWVCLVLIYIEQTLYSYHSICSASLDSWRALTLF